MIINQLAIYRYGYEEGKDHDIGDDEGESDEVLCMVGGQIKVNIWHEKWNIFVFGGILFMEDRIFIKNIEVTRWQQKMGK